MTDLRPQRPPKKLKVILAMTEPLKFLDALTDLAVPPGTNFEPLEKRHDLRQMIVTLRGLFLCVETDGIWKFLIEDGDAKWFARARVWLQRIGAARAGDYLDATASAFPRGCIPADDEKQANLLLEPEKVSTRLRGLDRAYKGAMNNMVECLRVHIRKHFEQFRAELEDGNGHAV